MTHVVTARCLDCRYTDCCEVCPVQAFYELEDPKMLVIDPGTCIDCMLCVPECPINAIYEEGELPDHYADWVGLNADLFQHGTNIEKQKDKASSAVGLDEVRAREGKAGWPNVEPGNAAH